MLDNLHVLGEQHAIHCLTNGFIDYDEFLKVTAVK